MFRMNQFLESVKESKRQNIMETQSFNSTAFTISSVGGSTWATCSKNTQVYFKSCGSLRGATTPSAFGGTVSHQGHDMSGIGNNPC